MTNTATVYIDTPHFEVRTGSVITLREPGHKRYTVAGDTYVDGYQMIVTTDGRTVERHDVARLIAY